MDGTATGPEPIRVVIVDDHILFKELITNVVNAMPGLKVVGWAQTEPEALQLCVREQPQVVILDLLLLPSSSGIVALHRIRSACRGAHILIFSGNLNPGIVRRVLAAGEFSLIGKSATLEEFRAALRAVATGRTYFSAEIADTIRSLVFTGNLPDGGVPHLTRREESVLGYLARGMTSREIAAALGLSRYTVANHRSRLMRKIGVHRTAQLSLYAASQGLLERPAPTQRKTRRRNRGPS
jgi:DNA-binding NarL/FixJ family response regulator